jgi:DNA-binding response OmpR family regulator
MTTQTERPLAGRTLLVVDDEPHLTRVVAFNLRRAGATVLTARDGEPALAVARVCRPDLVVTDFQMPGMDGCELARQLRHDPATERVPVLMLTARGHRVSPAELAGTNVRQLMGKPFSAAELLAQVRDLLASTVVAAA